MIYPILLGFFFHMFFIFYAVLRTQVPSIQEACAILIRFILHRLGKVSVYEIKWLLPALKSLCDGKSSARATLDLSGAVSSNVGTVTGSGSGNGGQTVNSSAILPTSGINNSGGGGGGGSSSTGTGANACTTTSALATATSIKNSLIYSTHVHGQQDNMANYFNCNQVTVPSNRAAVGATASSSVPLGSLQFDYNAVYMALKNSKYPENKIGSSVVSSNTANISNTTATGPVVSPPLSSSSASSSSPSTSDSSGSTVIERDSFKTDVKRSRSDLSSIIIHQLTTPLEVGKITWSPFTEELTDCSVGYQ